MLWCTRDPVVSLAYVLLLPSSISLWHQEMCQYILFSCHLFDLGNDWWAFKQNTNSGLLGKSCLCDPKTLFVTFLLGKNASLCLLFNSAATDADSFILCPCASLPDTTGYLECLDEMWAAVTKHLPLTGWEWELAGPPCHLRKRQKATAPTIRTLKLSLVFFTFPQVSHRNRMWVVCTSLMC